MTTEKFRLEVANERLWNGSKPVPTSNKAFQLLRLFVSNPNRLLTKDDILRGVWGHLCVSEGLIKEYVHDLRLALGDDPKHSRFIETVRGRGYRYLGGIETDVDCARSAVKRSRSANGLSLAVLAFASLSEDRHQEYFADGISEDIIIGLSKNPHLSVISRNSTFAFKGKSCPVRDIAEALDAQFVLEGSVRRIGSRLRITAKLIDATGDRHVWAETYDRDIGDIFAVRDEVVSSIVHALGSFDGAVERSAQSRTAGIPNTNLTAYDCYLKAQGHFHRRHGSGYDTAQKLYEEAIELDPRLARAYTALALLHFQRFKVYLLEPLENVRRKTRDLANCALQLDPGEYLAHWVLGRLYGQMGRRAQSLAAFERALLINPNDANVLADFADFLVYCDRKEEALGHCQRAIRLNPICPDWFWWHLGFTYFHLGRYQDALHSLERMVSPGQAHRLLAAVFAQLGRLGEAHDAAARFLSANPGFSIDAWASTQPYMNPKELQRYVDGMRKAGLPV